MSGFDVVTLGETLLRMAPPGHLRIEQAAHFELEAGGTESNTAVALARLGVRTTWISRLPNNPLGRRLARTLMGQGVDISRIIWAEGERLGLFFVEFGDGARATSVIYDRADSAASRMTPDELPAELFSTTGGRHLHLTGITLAISDNAAATAFRALQLAQEAGWSVSFDINYRAKLWTPRQSRRGCQPFAAAADLLFAPIRDAQTHYDLPESISAEDALAALQREFPGTTVILTLGADGSIAAQPGRPPVRQAIFAGGGTVGRIGAGDAFTAGVLYRYLDRNGDEWLADALRWGAAAAAMKYTIPGDMGLFEKDEVAALVESGGLTEGVSR
jgi:2-dehydro-3-deoxygluconokinase